MFLAEKGIEVEMEQAAGPRDMDLATWFLELDPRRRVPLLVLDDGTHVGEAMAICRYFDAQQPEPNLFGREPLAVALIEMWERESEINCLQAGGEHVRNSHPAFKDRALPGYSEPTPQIAQLAERGKMRYYEFLSRAEAQLERHAYLAGEQFSAADITAFCAVDFWQKFKLPLGEEHTRLKAWHERIGQRPSATA
jgi:glutathione S-transferase